MIRRQLAAALEQSLGQLGVEVTEVNLEQPARREHGDWSSNVVMANAKRIGRNPRELAQELIDLLNVAPPAHVERVEIAGPGFVNFYLAPTWLHDVARAVLNEGEERFAASEVGAGHKVMVEFVSANPTGPIHAGHARGATYGDSLARVLERAGFEVSREFYINDRGTQMAKMGESILAVAEGREVPEDGYRGEYIAEWAETLPDGADLSTATEHGYRSALDEQRTTLDRLGVSFDHWFSEREMIATGAIDSALADLRAQSMVYERDGATWLASTEYGDDKDRVLIKSDGEMTYLLPDIAYHRDKYERGFDTLINVWGADHHGYIGRMSAAIQALGHDKDSVVVIITQLVKLLRDGEELKISKRAGNIILLDDILDEVGADATRLTYLSQSVDTPQTVDLKLIAEKSMDNPVFYIQMAHARLSSVFRTAKERDIEVGEPAGVDLSALVHPRELEVMRTLNELPDLIALAAREHAPHRVSTWLRELASEVHGFYHDCPILRDDVPNDLRAARFALSSAALIGLRVGLGVLGAGAPEQM